MTTVQRIGEIWRFREVIRNFVSQELKVKYRRSALGFFWSLLNPLLMMAILSIVFTQLFGMRGDDRYPLYVLSGLPAWGFFAACVDGCSGSILVNEAYAKRQYFPKLVFPLSSVGQHLVTLVLSLFVLLSTVGWLVGFTLTSALAMLPLSFLCLLCAALGFGAIAAVVTVYFRDVQHLVQVALSAWFYLTPVIWPMSMMENRSFRNYFAYNPMYHMLELFHAPIHRGEWPPTVSVYVAAVFAAVVLTAGLTLFWRYEDDLIFRL